MKTPLTLTMSQDASLAGAPAKLIATIKKQLTLPNPKYQDAVKYGRWVGKNLKRNLIFYAIRDKKLHFPRGFANQAVNLCLKHGVKPEIIDKRRQLEPEEFLFSGTLRPYQEKAVIDITRRQFGVLEAGTGSGKTVMALAVAARRQQPTLIMVHTKELLYQWADKIQEFMDIGDPGLIGDGHFNLQPMTIAIINSAKKHLDELPQHFGQIIVDECHRCPSTMFTDVVKEFDCYYSLGLSATPYRRDNLTKLIYWYLGDPAHRVDAQDIQNTGAVLRPEISRRETGFTYRYRDDYSTMLTALTWDEARNRQIVDDIVTEAGQISGTILVVSDRVAHCQTLAEMLDERQIKTALLTGRTPAPERSRIVAEAREEKLNVLISTIQLVGEGFDCHGLHTVFLTTPIKFSARLLQVIGRIMRPAPGKKPKVIDYVDSQVGVLARAARAREETYEGLRG
ncbi:MAG: DEAD/DEAH box helicase [Thermodesulfobacteriota bacterium]|nr:DEAD/DEAH box helicase [Thermodesulfobacteriota bacterium]